VQAKAPPHLLEGSWPTEALLAQIAVSKHSEHMPLNRQAVVMARHGVPIERSVLADWMGRTGALIAPVVEHMAKRLMADSTRLYVDETTAPVLDPGRGVTKTGYLWALARDDRPWGGGDPPGVVCFYAPGRAGENAETFLTGFVGILQIDGYTGCNRLTMPSRKGGAYSGGPLLGTCTAQAAGNLRPRWIRDCRRWPTSHRRVLCRRGRYPWRLTWPASVRPSGPHRAIGGGLR
jgi:transposase